MIGNLLVFHFEDRTITECVSPDAIFSFLRIASENDQITRCPNDRSDLSRNLNALFGNEQKN